MGPPKDVDVDLDTDEVGALLMQRQYMELPGVLKPKCATLHPHQLHINIIPHVYEEGKENFKGKVDIIKHFSFSSSVPIAEAKELCSGQPCLIKIESQNVDFI